ncbi:MAG TPA: chloride channel protein [Terriglobales bacterium]|nr:chloride channel protein [Terriglobales bacterium]
MRLRLLSLRARWLGEFGEALSPHTLKVSGLAVLVGAASGYVALGLLDLIYLLTGFFFHGRWSLAAWTPLNHSLGAWVIAIPVIGGLLVGLMIYFWEPTLKGHGIPEAMQAVLIDKSIVRGRVAFLKPLATALAIGTGGPFGAEGPIIQTGAALGSLLGQRLKLTAYDRRVLLAAGAGAGMAATFLAPLAGLMVAIELILFEFRARSFIPAALACAIADAVAVHYRGNAPMFPTPLFQLRSMEELLLFALLGVVCGLIGLAMTKALFWLDAWFDKLPLRPVAIWAPVTGAAALGVIGYFFPEVFGTGYDTIRTMLNVKVPAARLLQVSAAKFWALVISLGSGTTGGVFAPSLVVGGGVGAAFAQGWHALLPNAPISPPAFYALAAMAAVFGSIARAPLTAVVFLFELSHNPDAVLPLIVCVMIADGTMRLFSANSMMTAKLAKRGLIVSQDYVAPQFLLWSTQAEEIMRPLPETGWSDASALATTAGESLAVLAHRMIEQSAEHALVMSAENPPQRLGIVTISDILALEQEMLKKHEVHRG